MSPLIRPTEFETLSGTCCVAFLSEHGVESPRDGFQFDMIQLINICIFPEVSDLGPCGVRTKPDLWVWRDPTLVFGTGPI